MATNICLVLYVIIIITMADFSWALRTKRIEERFVRLEERLETESKFRRADMWNLFDKIENMSSACNMSAKDARCQGQQEPRAENTLQTSSLPDLSKLCTDWRRDLIQLTMAFKNEKKLNAKQRKECPTVVNNDLHAVAADLKTLLNKTEVNQIKLMEHIHEMTELKDQQSQISELKNASFEIAELKKQLNELKETCNSKTEVSTLKNERFKSCVELYEKGHRESGQYDVYPDGRSDPIRVFCDQGLESGGGWTVFQRRKSGSENFFRGWMDYKLGFGDLDGEFWLGNEYLAILTSTCCSQLRIELENTDGEKHYAVYNTFQIKSANERYKLKVDGYSGNAGDQLSYHNGYQFTTKDVDNDEDDNNCALKCTGAWWYNACYASNLNGQFGIKNGIGIYWSGYRTFTEMKFRRLL